MYVFYNKRFRLKTAHDFVRIVLEKENFVLELAIPIKNVIEKSTLDDFKKWTGWVPQDAPWYVISDYCFADSSKCNDVATFCVIANHDTVDNLASFINDCAPKDIKSTRSVSPTFLSYINSPFVFSFTFVFDRSSKLMRDYATKENMHLILPDVTKFIKRIESASTYEPGYIESVLKRVKALSTSLESKNVNSRLSRQVYLVATLASVIFYYLNQVKLPSHIAWVSDRDAIIERCDGIVFDLSYFMFLSELELELVSKKSSFQLFDKPQFIFKLPARGEPDQYDPLIRIPDYLAGTLADFNMATLKFSKEKFNSVCQLSLLNSKNHVIIHISGDSQDLCARRIAYQL